MTPGMTLPPNTHSSDSEGKAVHSSHRSRTFWGMTVAVLTSKELASFRWVRQGTHPLQVLGTSQSMRLRGGQVRPALPSPTPEQEWNLTRH